MLMFNRRRAFLNNTPGPIHHQRALGILTVSFFLPAPTQPMRFKAEALLHISKGWRLDLRTIVFLCPLMSLETFRGKLKALLHIVISRMARRYPRCNR